MPTDTTAQLDTAVIDQDTATKLARSEARLRLAMEAARLGSFEWDLASGEVVWSPAIERMHGIPEGSFPGTFEAYRRDIHPDDLEYVLTTVQSSVAKGTQHHLTYRIIRPDGQVRWLEAHGQYERDEHGRPSRLLGVCRDITEQREAHESLEFQRYILGLVSDNTTAALFMVDRDGHPTFMNAAAVEMTGYALEEIEGMPLHYAIHHHRPDGSAYPMDECPLDRSLPENQPVRRHEDVFIRKDGSMFPVLCAASPIVENGAAIGTVVEVRDISEEKATQERLRVLAEAIPVQVWTATPDGMLDYVSSQGTKYFGVPDSALTGAGWTTFVHEDDLSDARERWARSLSTGEPYEAKFRLRRHDGEYRWHLARALPMRNRRNVVTRWFGTNTDFEELRSAELARDRALAEAETARFNLHRAFEHAPASISLTSGPEHRTIFQNAVSRKLAGDRDFTGMTAREALPELESQGFFELLDEVYNTGKPFVGTEVPVQFDIDNDGEIETSYFNLVYQPLRDPDGTVAGILTHSVNVTEQVLARQEIERKAEELARLARALERSNKELDQFAYVASHDLKAPLRGIANLTQWIEEDSGASLSAQSREHMRLLQGRVGRMEALIDGILSYSRAGRVRNRPERVETAILAAEVVDMLAPPPTVNVEIAPDLPVVIAERVALQQVLMNLIGNAIKFTSAHRNDGRITVNARVAEHPEACWEFVVEDNGPGIEPEFQERIWTIFQTLAPRDKVEGTGIGLSVVRKIVETRGGRAWVDSKPGSGTSFHFTWPATPAAHHNDH